MEIIKIKYSRLFNDTVKGKKLRLVLYASVSHGDSPEEVIKGLIRQAEVMYYGKSKADELEEQRIIQQSKYLKRSDVRFKGILLN